MPHYFCMPRLKALLKYCKTSKNVLIIWIKRAWCKHQGLRHSLSWLISANKQAFSRLLSWLIAAQWPLKFLIMITILLPLGFTPLYSFLSLSKNINSYQNLMWCSILNQSAIFISLFQNIVFRSHIPLDIALIAHQEKFLLQFV